MKSCLEGGLVIYRLLEGEGGRKGVVEAIREVDGRRKEEVRSCKIIGLCRCEVSSIGPSETDLCVEGLTPLDHDCGVEVCWLNSERGDCGSGWGM